MQTTNSKLRWFSCLMLLASPACGGDSSNKSEGPPAPLRISGRLLATPGRSVSSALTVDVSQADQVWAVPGQNGSFSPRMFLSRVIAPLGIDGSFELEVPNDFSEHALVLVDSSKCTQTRARAEWDETDLDRRRGCLLAYIAVPDAQGESMISLPTNAMVQDVSLNDITPPAEGSDEASSEVTLDGAAASFSMSLSELQALARVDDVLKGMIASYVNSDDTFTDFVLLYSDYTWSMPAPSVFEHAAQVGTAPSDFTAREHAVIIDTNLDVPALLAGTASGAPPGYVELVAPGFVDEPSLPRRYEPGEPIRSGDVPRWGFFTGGADGSIAYGRLPLAANRAVPAGDWIVRREGRVVAKAELAVSAPYQAVTSLLDPLVPLVYVPTLELSGNDGSVTSATVRLYQHDGERYRLVDADAPGTRVATPIVNLRTVGGCGDQTLGDNRPSSATTVVDLPFQYVLIRSTASGPNGDTGAGPDIESITIRRGGETYWPNQIAAYHPGAGDLAAAREPLRATGPEVAACGTEPFTDWVSLGESGGYLVARFGLVSSIQPGDVVHVRECGEGTESYDVWVLPGPVADEGGALTCVQGAQGTTDCTVGPMPQRRASGLTWNIPQPVRLPNTGGCGLTELAFGYRLAGTQMHFAWEEASVAAHLLRAWRPLSDAGLVLETTVPTRNFEIGAAFPCASLLREASLLGASATCTRVSSTRFVASREPDATLVVGDVVTLPPSTLRWPTSQLWVSEQSTVVQAPPDAPWVSVNPSVNLTMNRAYPCDTLEVDATDARGGGGQPLTYEWSMTGMRASSADPLPPAPPEVAALLATHTADTLSLPARMLPVGEWRLHLVVRNYAGAFSRWDYAVRRVTDVEYLTVDAPVVVNGDGLLIASAAMTRGCAPSVPLQFEWTIGPPDVTVPGMSASTLVIPAGTFAMGTQASPVSYPFTLRVKSPDDEWVSASRTVYSQERTLLPSLGSSPRLAVRGAVVTLDPGEVRDIFDRPMPLTYARWYCVDASGADCGLALPSGLTLNLDTSPLAPGTYTIWLQAGTDGYGSVGSTSVDVVVQPN